MSIYRTPYYEGETNIALARLIGLDALDESQELVNKVLNFDVENVETGKDPYTGKFSKIYDRRTYKQLFPRDAQTRPFDDRIVPLISSTSNLRFGLKYAYKFAYQVVMDEISFDEVFDWKKHSDAMKLVTKYALVGSMISPNDAEDESEYMRKPAHSVSRRIENAHMRILGINRIRLTRKYKALLKDGKWYPEVRPEGFFDDFTAKKFKFYKIRNIFLLVNKTDSYVFTFKDIKRISDILRSCSRVIEYATGKSSLSQDVDFPTACIKLVKHYLKIASSTDRPNIMAQIADLHYHLFLAEHALDVTNRSQVLLREKIREKGYDDIMTYESVRSITRGLKFSEEHELMKVYKIFHVPDYIPGKVMNALREKHRAPNEIRDEALFEEFRLYRKRAFMLRQYVVNGKFPGEIPGMSPDDYEILKPTQLVEDIVRRSVLTGCLDYCTYEGRELEPIKDKSCASSNGYLRDDCNPMDRNYALYALRSHHMANRQEIYNVCSGVSKVIDIAFKPEAKKETSRPFMMANPERRFMLSEFEENVGFATKGKKGIFMGKSYAEKMKMFRTICLDDLSKRELKGFFISFDIASFSPHFPTRMKDYLFDFWDDVFDVDVGKKCKELFNGSTLRHTWKGFVNEYKINGNDLEGFNGRINTDFHVDLMAFAIKKAKEVFKEVEYGNLAVMIDDGLLRVITNEDLTKERIIEISNHIEKTYMDLGIEISWDKTIVSQEFAIFLNEVVYKRRHVQSGLKSFIRIGPEDRNPLNGFTDIVEEITANAIGSVTAGCDLVLVNRRYLSECVNLELRWNRGIKDITKNIIIRYFSSTQMGGYGVVPASSLSANIGYCQTSTAISFFRQIIAQNYRSNDKEYASIRRGILQSVKNIEPKIPSMSFLRNPAHIAFTTPKAYANNDKRTTEEIVDRITNNSIVRNALDNHSITDYDAVANSFLSQTRVNATSVKLWYKTSALNIIDKIVNKFSKTNTIASMISYQDKLIIRARNLSAFKRCVEYYMTTNF